MLANEVMEPFLRMSRMTAFIQLGVSGSSFLSPLRMEPGL